MFKQTHAQVSTASHLQINTYNILEVGISLIAFSAIVRLNHAQAVVNYEGVFTYQKSTISNFQVGLF